jgi:hypothetical protein
LPKFSGCTALIYDVSKEQEARELMEKTVAELGELNVVTYLWSTPVIIINLSLINSPPHNSDM